ncbi:MAG: PKD domain-containing protein, partial [Methanosarcinaceae archaeon]|nr:PKD domain-containing protein [Methanosarcinaceae archaeon]
KFKKLKCVSVIPTCIKAPEDKLSEGEVEAFSVEVAQLASIDTVNFKLEFNESLLTIDNVTFSEDISGNLVWDVKNGLLNVSASPNSPISVEEYTELVDITFNATGDVPFPGVSTPLTFTEAKVVKGLDESDIDLKTNGALELLPATTIKTGDANLQVGDKTTFTVAVKDLQAEKVDFVMNFNNSLISVKNIKENKSDFTDLKVKSKINNKAGWFTVSVESKTTISSENLASLVDINIKSTGVPGKGALTFGTASWSTDEEDYEFNLKIPGEVNVTSKEQVVKKSAQATIKNVTFYDEAKKVRVNTSSGNINVSGDRKTIEIRNSGLNINLNSTDEGGFKQNGTAAGVLEGNFTAQIEKSPVEAPVGGEIGNVTPSFGASVSGALSNLTRKGAALNVSVTPGIPKEKAGKMFSLAGFNIEEVAYTMSIEKKNLTGVNFKNATIVMPVPQSYVNERGGPKDFKILSINDSGYVTNLSTTYTQDNDSVPPLYIFKAISPDGFSDKILVKAPGIKKPVADFTYTPSTIKDGDSVNFMDNSSNTPTTWDWNFGDGTAHAAISTPVHSFEKPGNYTVTLNASNSAGWSETTKAITVGTEPEANFTALPKGGDASLSVKFTDLSENATAWAWDFGDGIKATVNNAAEKNVTHLYRKAGTYNVSLTVTNAYGSDTVEKPSYIHVTASSRPPVANFTATPLSGESPLTVQFMDLSENEPTGLAWDFGDGSSSFEASPVHTYTAAGTYTVSLNVSNALGSDSTTRTDYITVSPKDSGSSRGSSPGIAPGEPDKNVNRREISQVYVSAGSTTKMILRDETNDVTYVAFISETNAGKAVIKVEILNGKHSLASKDPEGEVYRNLNIEISKGIGKKIESGTVGFKVSKQWLEENNINLETIVLQHYVDGEWVNCPTTKTEEDEGNFYFEAEVSSFSPFAITGEKTGMEIVPTPRETPDKTDTGDEETKPVNKADEKKPLIPGFTSLVGFIAVLLTGQVLMRRKK